MKKYLIIVVLTSCLFLPAGCDEQELQKVDKVAEAAEQWGYTTDTVIGSPAGQTIPADIRMWLALGAAGVSGLANAWQQWRSRQTKKVGKSIVNAIEEVGRTDENKFIKDQLKPAIQLELVKNGVCLAGKKMIIDLKQ